MDSQREFYDFIDKHSELFTSAELAALKSGDPVAVAEIMLNNSPRFTQGTGFPGGFSFPLPTGSDYRGALKEIRLYKMLLPGNKIKAAFLYATHIGSVVFSPGYYTRRANYPYFLLIFTFQGEGTLEYDGRTYQIKPGDGFLIDGRNPHCYYATSDKGWGYDIIEFNGAAMPQYYEAVAKNSQYKYTFTQDSRFIQQLSDLKSAVMQLDESILDYMVNLSLTCLLTEIISLHQAEKLRNIPDWVKTATAYIKSHYQNAMTLDQLAEQTSVSKYHFAREFKKYTGKTFIDYLGDIRLLQARQYLLSTQLPVAIIAELVGYQSVPYFITLFKNREGTTPHQFRRGISQ
ncbi:AraC family transcriptional regulator [Ruminococcaceae bacterium OttesenSCG-928-A11]|nr:AraC family transcriptional regulator [Ruminococcaceae bacterium OttesenSCG-928-A11]